MRFKDIPQLTRRPGYAVSQDWEYLENTLDYYKEHYGLDLDPDFQRGHVWTEAQQIAYVEFCLRGGESANRIYFNCPHWQGNKHVKEMVLVDGKQRLTAVRRFMNNEIPAFGAFYMEYEDRLPMLGGATFITCINDLPTKEAVLRWYLEMNSGGTPHTDEELRRVQELLDKTTNEKGITSIMATQKENSDWNKAKIRLWTRLELAKLEKHKQECPNIYHRHPAGYYERLKAEVLAQERRCLELENRHYNMLV